VGLVILWWFASRDSTSFYYPPLRRILAVLRQDWFPDHLRTDLLPSLRNLGAGLALAVVAGVAGGIALGRSPYLYRSLRPIIDLIRSVPGVALVPIVLAVLGPGPNGKVLLVMGSTVWPILLNTVDGVRGLDLAYTDVVRVYRVPWRDELVRVILPGASPQIMLGIRLATSLAVIVTVVSEMYAATAGVGYYVVRAQESFAVAETWAGTIVLGMMGYALATLVALVERRVLGWHTGMRAGSDHGAPPSSRRARR